MKTSFHFQGQKSENEGCSRQVKEKSISCSFYLVVKSLALFHKIIMSFH